MNTGQIILIVFAVVIETGGFVGFKVGKSKPSLIAGTSSAALLFIAFGLTYVDMAAGLWTGTVVSGLLCLVFVMRLAKTRTVMPSGMLLALSIGATVLLAREALALTS